MQQGEDMPCHDVPIDQRRGARSGAAAAHASSVSPSVCLSFTMATLSKPKQTETLSEPHPLLFRKIPHYPFHPTPSLVTKCHYYPPQATCPKPSETLGERPGRKPKTYINLHVLRRGEWIQL